MSVFALMVGSAFAGVQFKGMTWYHSDSPSGLLFVNGNGKLEWRPVKPHQLTVRIPEQRLNQAGDVAEFRLTWSSTGDSGCECANVTDYYGYFCNDDAVDCLAGTGDFRMGLFDSSDQGYVESDGLGLEPSIFSGYLGYAWRFFPHLDPNTIERVYQHKDDGTKESHTNLSFWERTNPSLNSLLSTSNSYNRMGGPVAGGFDLPLGAEAVLTLRLERLSASSVRIVINFNGYQFEKTDTTSTYQPQKIDVFAIQFPNARPYDYVKFDVLTTGLDGDFNSDCVVDACDLSVLAGDWLESEFHGYIDPQGTEPDANHLPLWYRLDETEGNQAHDSSDNGYTGTLVGANNWNPDGRSYGCLNFYDDTAIAVPTAVLSNIDQQITVSVWVYGYDSTGRDNIVFDTGTGDTFLRAIIPNIAENVLFRAGNDTTDTLVWSDSNSADWRDSWVHYAFVKNADALKIYRNAHVVAQKTGATPSISGVRNQTFDIGAYVSHNNDYKGRIDEFRIYDYALSDDEVLYLAKTVETFIPLTSQANLHNDGVINFKDHAVFALQWLETCQ